MHREGNGFAAANQLHRQRGSLVIYMLMVLAEAMRTGQGAERRCQQRRIRRTGTDNHWVWRTICCSSAGPVS